MDQTAVEEKIIKLCEFSPKLQPRARDWAKMFAFIKHIHSTTWSSFTIACNKLDIAIEAFGQNNARVPPYHTVVTVYEELEAAVRAHALALDQEWAAWKEIIYMVIRCSQDEKERHRREELQAKSEKVFLGSCYTQFEWLQKVLGRGILGQFGEEEAQV
jgi:hypothetical protein